jgi:hypothetical protein
MDSNLVNVDIPANMHVGSFGDCKSSRRRVPFANGAGCYMACEAGYRRAEQALCVNGEWAIPEEPCVPVEHSDLMAIQDILSLLVARFRTC